MARELYYKEGDLYMPLPHAHAPHFPADGVWLVHEGGHTLLTRLGDVPSPMQAAALERHRTAMMIQVAETMALWRQGDGLSARMFVDALFRVVLEGERQLDRDADAVRGMVEIHFARKVQPEP